MRGLPGVAGVFVGAVERNGSEGAHEAPCPGAEVSAPCGNVFPYIPSRTDTRAVGIYTNTRLPRAFVSRCLVPHQHLPGAGQTGPREHCYARGYHIKECHYTSSGWGTEIHR